MKRLVLFINYLRRYGGFRRKPHQCGIRYFRLRLRFSRVAFIASMAATIIFTIACAEGQRNFAVAQTSTKQKPHWEGRRWMMGLEETVSRGSIVGAFGYRLCQKNTPVQFLDNDRKRVFDKIWQHRAYSWGLVIKDVYEVSTTNATFPKAVLGYNSSGYLSFIYAESALFTNEEEARPTLEKARDFLVSKYGRFTESDDFANKGWSQQFVWHQYYMYRCEEKRPGMVMMSQIEDGSEECGSRCLFNIDLKLLSFPDFLFPRSKKVNGYAVTVEYSSGITGLIPDPNACQVCIRNGGP